jgi:hypothetical protein
MGMARMSEYLELDEESVTNSLEGSASFLDSIGCTRPYNWIVGIEHVSGRKLFVAPRRVLGRCLADVIEREGKYEKGDKPAELLEPFFEDVFDRCGAQRTLG